MNKLLLTLGLALCFLGWSHCAQAQLAEDCTPGSTCGQVNISSGSSTTVTLTTSNKSDVVCAGAEINSSGSGTPTFTSITSTHTTGWASVKDTNNGTGDSEVLWCGTTTAILSAETITLNFNATVTFATVTVIAVSGANTASYQDADSPYFSPSCCSSTLPNMTATTATANTFIFGCYRIGVTSPTAGAGWVQDSGANFQLCEHQIVSTKQSGLSFTIGTGSGQSGAGVGLAIVAAPAAAAGGGALLLLGNGL